jgi:hypothetical protein
MASSRLVRSVPGPTVLPRPQAAPPPGRAVAVMMTMIALVPFCGVIGYLFAAKFGVDRVLCVLVMALLGMVYSFWKGDR